MNVITHLALYTVFHRGFGNRLVHAVCVPLILSSGLVFLAYLGHQSPLLHAGTFVALALVALLASVDVIGAAVVLSWLGPAVVAAGLAVEHGAWFVLLPASAAVHLAGWAATVWLGHLRLEPLVSGGEDSNLYFRRGYFTATDVGPVVGLLDRAIQFSVAPLSVSHDVLVWCGLRRGLEALICDERERVLERLHRGDAPLEVS